MGDDVRHASLTIPLETPSMNWRDKVHWARRHQWKRQASLLIRNALQLGGRENYPFSSRVVGRVTVVITRYGWQRIMDPDNLTGGVKDLLDVLKRCDLFEDDDEKHIDLVVHQDVDRKRRRTEVTLRWLETGPGVASRQRRRTPLSLYVSPSVADDVKAESKRLNASISAVLAEAWRLARPILGRRSRLT